jgi:chromatin remodeling complex protein RSC6
MVRQSKTSAVSTTKEVPATPVEKTKKSKKANVVVESSAAPTPVADAPVAAAAPEVVDAVEVTDVSQLSVRLNEYGSKIQQAVSILSVLKNDYRSLEKAVAREIKLAQKASSKRKKSSGNRQPSGFVKPTRISDELAVFLSKPIGTELARTSVSKEINQYIRTNALQDPSNGRKIFPDAKLSKLLNVTKEDEVTYFNLQRYMKHHFVKNVPVVAAV